MNLKQKMMIPVVLTSILILASSWGFLVHRTVHQLAIYELPQKVQPFFYAHMDYLIKNATRPDERRNQDSTEATKHFIDLEIYGEDAAHLMPQQWPEAVAKYTEDTLKKYGWVPYVVVAMQQRLTQAFKAGNKDSILFYAADLGHYIGDAHVPLHTSVNYDGQLTNQKGLHALWESVIPEIEIEQYNLYSKHKATYLKNPTAAIWQAIQHSYALTKDVFDKEIEVSKDFTDATKYRIQMRKGKEVKYYTTAFAKAYSAALKGTIQEQLIHSANLIADFWYTAWVDAGKPDLQSLYTLTPEQTAQLQTEQKAYKDNQLLPQNLLKAKENKEHKE